MQSARAHVQFFFLFCIYSVFVIGFVVHKQQGLMSGLLRDLLTSPLSHRGHRGGGAGGGAGPSAPSYHHAPTLLLFAWDMATHAHPANARVVDARGREGGREAERQGGKEEEEGREAPVSLNELGGMDERVGLGGLRAAEAAQLVNVRRVHVLVDLMGWIPEGRQSPTLETFAMRPCAVQVGG